MSYVTNMKPNNRQPMQFLAASVTSPEGATAIAKLRRLDFEFCGLTHRIKTKRLNSGHLDTSRICRAISFGINLEADLASTQDKNERPDVHPRPHSEHR